MNTQSIGQMGILITIITGTLGTALPASDWPDWRGPKRDGLSSEKDLNFDWDKSGPPLLWRTEGCGRGYSSVAVAKGRIFTLGRIEEEDAECLIAFNEADGAFLWKTPFGKSGHSNGTPVVDGDFVYAIGRDGQLVCCRAGTGEIVWSKDFKNDFGGKMMSGWGYSETPLIDGDRLVCTPGGQEAMIVALEKASGELIWKSPVPDDLGDRGEDGAGYASIVVSHAADVKQYVQLTGRGLLGFRAGDGKLLWSYNKIANGTANIPTPIVSGDTVFASTGYGTGAALLRLAKDGEGVKAEEVYFLDANRLQNHHGGMLLIDGYVYCGHGHNNGFPICVKMDTGEVIWGGKQRGAGSESAAVTYADGRLIFRYQNGVVGVVEATPEGYRLETSFKPVYQEDNSWAHPVVANGKLYLREQDVLMCYDLRK